MYSLSFSLDHGILLEIRNPSFRKFQKTLVLSTLRRNKLIKIKPVRRFRRIKKSCGNCAAGLYYGWDLPLAKFECQRPGGPELNPKESEEYFHVCARWTSKLLSLEIEEKKKSHFKHGQGYFDIFYSPLLRIRFSGFCLTIKTAFNALIIGFRVLMGI